MNKLYPLCFRSINVQFYETDHLDSTMQMYFHALNSMASSKSRQDFPETLRKSECYHRYVGVKSVTKLVEKISGNIEKVEKFLHTLEKSKNIVIYIDKILKFVENIQSQIKNYDKINKCVTKKCF